MKNSTEKIGEPKEVGEGSQIFHLAPCTPNYKWLKSYLNHEKIILEKEMSIIS